MNKSKLSKAERLASNIRIQGSVYINSKNEKAAVEAIELLSMKLDEFNIERDCDDYNYLRITKKHF
jgi:virulence-associated protein VapD